MSGDPYATLGVKKTATADEIRKAYRKLARESHPDLNPGDPAAEARFKAAAQAYDLLKDPETRARFDRGEIDAAGAERPERQFYRDYAGAPENPYQTGQGFDDMGDAADIFAEFLRRHGQRPGGGDRTFQTRGPDRRFRLDVPFLDAVRGGRARVVTPEGGALEVEIPAGVADGQTLRLRGKGGPGFGGGPAGDAFITLSVLPHPQFRRQGSDILLTLPISLDEAVLGGKVEVPTIDGQVKLTIPKGASSGRTLRLRGRGAQAAGGGRGDQLVELRIVMPPQIDDTLTEFFETWRKTHRYDPREGTKP